jgi:hypothetical protein
MEIRPVEAMLIQVERQTDGRTHRWTYMTKVTGAFCNYANMPKNGMKNEFMVFAKNGSSSSRLEMSPIQH